MKAQVEVIYFLGCPNAIKVIEAMQAGSIAFDIVIQDQLPQSDSRLSMSSPSVLVNGIQIIGRSGSASCTFDNFSPKAVLRLVKSALAEDK